MAENRISRTVLLVDDDESVRRYAKAVLRRQGLHVLEAADGVAALALLHEIGGKVDILVTDIQMPRMTGIELVEAVKVAFPKIPVIYASGEQLKPPIENAPSRTVFLPKPYLPHALVQAVWELSQAENTDSGFRESCRL